MSSPKTNPFETLRGSKRDVVKSNSWYRGQIQTLGFGKITPATALTSSIGELKTSLVVGSMYLFAYNPKLRDTLPVYDQFPLVFPFRKIPGGFVGLNLHYLPYLLRAKLLSRLFELSNAHSDNPKRRLLLSWSVLNNTARFPGVKACVKHYLYSQVQSRFLKINPLDWRAAIFLPLERFKKMNKDQVFRESMKVI